MDLTVPIVARVDLPGRGTSFVREGGDGTADATVLLVHGWFASAGLNWTSSFAPLCERFSVLAPDLRGHGRGIRTWRPFSLEACADDLAALIELRGCGPVVVVGYSMGGPVAQLLWRRHPELVAGLVLCSTTRVFLPGRARQRYVVATSMSWAAGMVRASRMTRRFSNPLGLGMTAGRGGRRPESMRRWAAAEVRRHDVRQLLEAGRAACTFDSRSWIGDVDVPTAVIVTTQDQAIPVREQRRLAEVIPGATVREIDGDHLASTAGEFAPVLVEACLEVARRAGLVSEEPKAAHR